MKWYENSLVTGPASSTQSRSVTPSPRPSPSPTPSPLPSHAAPPTFAAHAVGDLDHAIPVVAVDLDQNGDLDLLSGSHTMHTVVWFEQVRASGGPPAWVPHTISSSSMGVYSLYAAALDADADVDVITANKEGASGQQVPWSPHAVFGPGPVSHPGVPPGPSLARPKS